MQEALFLDDPSRSKIDIADLKSFVTVDEEGTCQGRYNDSRLARNQMRAVASNDIVQAEPRIDPASTTTISPDAFFDLIEPVFRDDHVKDRLAVMKRASFFVFSDSGLFIRLPSEKHDAIIHRVVVDDVHKKTFSLPRTSPSTTTTRTVPWFIGRTMSRSFSGSRR